MTTAVRFTIPGWVNEKEVFDLVSAKVEMDNILGLQSFGTGRFEVMLSNAALGEKLLEEGLTVGERTIEVSIYNDPRTWTRVKGFPLMESDDEIIKFLSAFGKITKVSHETHDWNTSVKSGIRRVLMAVTKEIPDVARIGNWKCLIRGPRVKRACFKCLQMGHEKANCTSKEQTLPVPQQKKEKEKKFTVEVPVAVESGNNVESKEAKRIEEKREKPEGKKDIIEEKEERPEQRKENAEENRKRRNQQESSGSSEDSVLDRMSEESTASFLDSLHSTMNSGRKIEQREQPWRKQKKKERRHARRESVDHWSLGW